ncbi:MAG: hypothetical protein FJ139_05045 [Deltaproteobacteria bacterium]|nr:hypothetical protein [Deltaproteobacteria bacterium]
MDYRINKDALYDTLAIWNGYLKRKVHIIACGGTALTLLGVKDSTKDIDLIIPNAVEYSYLIKTLQDIGYKQVTQYGWSSGDLFIFDIFIGNYVYSTALLESPLNENNHTLIKEFSSLYLGVLNDYDLIITKIFRGTEIDLEDCLDLITYKKGSIDLDKLERRYRETASYDISEERVIRNFALLIEKVKGA